MDRTNIQSNGESTFRNQCSRVSLQPRSSVCRDAAGRARRRYHHGRAARRRVRARHAAFPGPQSLEAIGFHRRHLDRWKMVDRGAGEKRRHRHHRLDARAAEGARTGLRVDSKNQFARAGAEHPALRKPRSRGRVRCERRPRRRPRRHRRQPMGAQRQSGAAGVSGGQLFGRCDGRERGGGRAHRARAYRGGSGNRGLATRGRAIATDGRRAEAREDDDALSWAAGSARTDPVLPAVRGLRSQVPVRRVRQCDVLGKIRTRGRFAGTGLRSALRKCAMGNSRRTLADSQGHPRTGDPHETARRMAQDSARGRRAMRSGHDAPGIHRVSANRRHRDAPGDSRSDPRRHRAARRAGHTHGDAG